MASVTLRCFVTVGFPILYVSSSPSVVVQTRGLPCRWRDIVLPVPTRNHRPQAEEQVDDNGSRMRLQVHEIVEQELSVWRRYQVQSRTTESVAEGFWRNARKAITT